ncbi:MAG: hypothetical protein WBI27_19210 [Thermoanaerobaculia bacterium]
MCSRRYKQKGYMDDDSPQRREPKGPPKPRSDRPRGRGLGAPTETVFRCARCGTKETLSGPIGLLQTCRSCGSDLHTCTNCKHFDTSAPNQCREAEAKPIAKKATRNECELFMAKGAKEFKADSGKPDDPKDAFDALFDF